MYSKTRSCFQECTGKHKQSFSHQLAQLVKRRHTFTEQINYVVPAAKKGWNWWCRSFVLICVTGIRREIQQHESLLHHFFLAKSAGNCLGSVNAARCAERLQLLRSARVFLPAQGVQGQQMGTVTFLMGRDEEGGQEGGGGRSSCLQSSGERGQEKGNLETLLAGIRND